MRLPFAMRKMLFPLLFAAVTWGAPITTFTYEVGIGPVNRDGIVLDAWGFTLMALPDPAIYNAPFTADGSPGEGMTLTRVDIRNDWSIDELNLRAWIDSAAYGRFMYEFRRSFSPNVGTYSIDGIIWGTTFEAPAQATVVVHTPEPSTALLLMTALTAISLRASRYRIRAPWRLKLKQAR